MAIVSQSKPYTSSPAITATTAVNIAGAKYIVGAHNLDTAAQTATVAITDANGGANLGTVTALGVGAFWSPPLPGILVPSGSFTATPSTTVTGKGIIILYSSSA